MTGVRDEGTYDRQPEGLVGKTTSALYVATCVAEYLGGTSAWPVVGLLDRNESKNLTELLRLRPDLLHPGVVLLIGETLPPATAGLEFVINTPSGLTAIPSLQEARLVLVSVHPEDQGATNLVK